MIPIYRENPYLWKIESVVDAVSDDGTTQLITVREQIFCEGGGQPRDYGKLIWNGEERVVTELVKHKGDTRLRVEAINGLSRGDSVQCQLDEARRLRIMRLHSTQHGIAGALRSILSSYQTLGMNISEDATCCAMRFSADKCKEEALEEVRSILASARSGKVEVRAKVYSSENEAKLELGSLYRPSAPNVAIKGKLRVVVIDGLDANACGGTHVKSFEETGEISVLTLSEETQSSFSITFAVEAA